MLSTAQNATKSNTKKDNCVVKFDNRYHPSKNSNTSQASLEQIQYDRVIITFKTS